MQTQEFIVVRAKPSLHPLSSSFNPKLEVPLIQGFQTKPSNNTIELWFQFTLLDFWLQVPFTLLKRYPTFEQLPLKYLQIKDLTKILTQEL